MVPSVPPLLVLVLLAIGLGLVERFHRR
jgi:hypothetical protein